MFTGIITHTTTVQAASKKNRSLFIEYKKPKSFSIHKGESIAIDGVCSTVCHITRSVFKVEYMPETVQRTTVGSFKKGTVVNLEMPLQVGSLIGGHFVQGHVDARGKVVELKKKGNSLIIKVQVPSQLVKYIAQKGSIAVNGVSLTVVNRGARWFIVSLVRYTLTHTNLSLLRRGSHVNIETDILAKYVKSR